MVLTIGVCYHCGIEQREEYRKAVSHAFHGNYALDNGEKSILEELNGCMGKFISALEVDKNPDIAINSSLVENAFMMFICIEMRVPLFLVGKPGSSKSLTKTTVTNAMQGSSSSSPFFREFKQQQSFSFQCSQHTTAGEIMNIFKQAAIWQKTKKDLSRFVGVVVLDEVGLAEDSEKLPLKTLHPLMESGFSEPGATLNETSKVSFVGISNWALDGAKMNRALLLMRGTPGIDELITTAKTICRISTDNDSPLSMVIEPLASAYTVITADDNFYGLRDFYSMFKMIYKEYQTMPSDRPFPALMLSTIIQRNFGGSKDQEEGRGGQILSVFENKLRQVSSYSKFRMEKESALELVRQNLAEMQKRREIDAVFENRYLLLMTDNFSAFHFLPQLLNLPNYEIIFGSSFPQDKELIQLCRVMNKIKICMESGTSVVLLNLGSLHESLYDALNQCYVYYGGRRYVDMGLGANRVKCSVDLGFRLIMVEDEQKARELPIPFLNRMEKHFVGVDCILNQKLEDCLRDLKTTLDIFTNLKRKDKPEDSFSLEHVFVGYQQDTAACLLVQYGLENQVEEIDAENISNWALKKMMQMCTSDALWRSRRRYPQYLSDMYESRSSLSDFLWNYIYTESRTLSTKQVELSTFCRIPSAKDIEDLNKDLMKKKGDSEKWRECIEVLNLSTFRTEIEFTKKVNQFYRNATQLSDDHVKILFITCAKGERNVNLISCAKYCVQNIHREANVSKLYIIFVVSLPRNWYESEYSCFSVGKWENFHIDDLVNDESFQILSKISPALNADFTLKHVFALKSRNGTSTDFQNRLLREVTQETVAELNVANKQELLNSVFDLLNSKTADETLETFFLDKIAAMIPESGENSVKINDLVEDASFRFQEVINTGTLEKLVFAKLKNATKPFVKDFLELIDLGNNVHLLNHGTWERVALTGLMQVKGICSKITQGNVSQAIEAKFPYSSRIVQRMIWSWEQAQELHKHQHSSTDIDAFLNLFRTQNEPLYEILTEIVCNHRDAIEGFKLDMIRLVLKIAASNNESSVRSINNGLSALLDILDYENEIDRIFAVFMKMTPALRNILPVFKLILKDLSPTKFEKVISREKTLEENCTQFVSPFLDATLDNIKATLDKQLNGTSVNREMVERIEASVWDLKMYLRLHDGCREEFMLSLEKTSLISYYLYQLSFNLDTNLTTQVCTASKNFSRIINTSIKQKSNLGEAKFLRYLIMFLDQAATSVNKYIIGKEKGGQEKCAKCDGNFSSTVPYIIACQNNHACCENCIENMFDHRIFSESNQDGIFCRICDKQCSPSNHFERFKPSIDVFSNYWKQFRENVSNVFIGIVDQYVSPNATDETIDDLIKECLVPVNRYPYKTDDMHNWKDFRLKMTIVLILATKLKKMFPRDPKSGAEIAQAAGFHASISRVFENSLSATTEVRKRIDVDPTKTCNLMVLAFEYCFANNCADVISIIDEEVPVGKLALIAQTKFEVRNFVERLAVDNKYNLELVVPESTIESCDAIRKVKNEIASSIDPNLVRNFIVRSAYQEHGTEFLAKMIRSRHLRFLIPVGLLNEKVFTDIYLMLGESYQQTVNRLHETLVSKWKEAFLVIKQIKDTIIRSLIAYRYLVETNNKSLSETEQKLREELLKKQKELIGKALANSNCALAATNVGPNDNLKLFVSLLAYIVPQERSVLKPLHDLKSKDTTALFLPTFKDSHFKIAQNFHSLGHAGLDDTLNLCPNGHPYIIGDCGRPWRVYKCTTCSVEIGGTGHRFVSEQNTPLGKIADLIREENRGQHQQNAIGYKFDDDLDENYRGLNALTSSLIQLLMHSFLFLKNYDIRFLNRAEQNLEKLPKILSESKNPISEDDTLKFCVHFVGLLCAIRSEDDFVSEQRRENWENMFINTFRDNRHLIGSVVKEYDRAYSLDRRSGSGELAKIISDNFQKETLDFRSREMTSFPQFWSVNTVVCANALEVDQFDGNRSAPCPLLEAMLQHREILPKLQHLPKLIKLFDTILFHCNQDKLSSQSYSLAELLTEVPVKANELKQLCLLFFEIWNDSIKCESQDSLSLESPVSHFVLGKNANDSCASHTVERLINVNNNLVQKYFEINAK